MVGVGDRVRMGSRSGRVVACRNGGMFDIQFDDVAHIERRGGDRLMRANPAELDVYDPSKDQFRAVVQGVYESLREKDPTTGTRELLSRAYAIATRQGQKYGWLKPGTQEPTMKGILRALERQREGGERRQRYERTLSAARGGTRRTLTEVSKRGRLVSKTYPNPRYVVHPEDILARAIAGGFISREQASHRDVRYAAQVEAEDLASRWPEGEGFGSSDFTAVLRGFLDSIGVKTHYVGGRLAKMNPRRNSEDGNRPLRGRGLHRAAVAEGRAKRSGESPLGAEYAIAHPMPKGHVRGTMSREQMESRFTPTMIMAVPPLQDPDLLGYVVIVFDPANRRLIGALDSYAAALDEKNRRFGSEWVHMPNVSAIDFGGSSVEFRAGRGETVERVAPAVHIVSHIGRGQWVVSGPMARRAREGQQGDVHSTEKEARERALELDARAARYGVPMVHDVVDVAGGYAIRGPREDEVYNNFFDDYEKAERVARVMDRKEASSGANPIAARRTRAGMSPQNVARALNRMKALLNLRGVTVMREPSNSEISSILRGPGASAPMAEYLHMNLAQVKRDLLRRGMSEAEADAFVEAEKEKRKGYMARRLELEPTRGVAAPEYTERKPARTAGAEGPSSRAEAARQELERRRAMKKNGMASTALKYGGVAFRASKEWFGTPFGREVTMRIVQTAAALGLTGALSRGTLSKEQADIIARQSGVDPTLVRQVGAA